MNENENLPKGSVSEEEKPIKQSWYKGDWVGKWTPKRVELGGFLAGALLVTLIWIVVSHSRVGNYGRQSFHNNQGMGMRYSNGPFAAIDNDIAETRRVNNRMMGNFNMMPQVFQGGIIQDLSGTMAFYLNGKKVELPYTVKDKKLNMDVKSLTEFMNANPGEKVAFSVSTIDGQAVSNFTTVKDFGGDQLSYDLKDGQRYLINLNITDDKGNQIVSDRQVI